MLCLRSSHKEFDWMTWNETGLSHRTIVLWKIALISYVLMTLIIYNMITIFINMLSNLSQNAKILVLVFFLNLNQPSKHTTLFQRCNNVSDVQTTSRSYWKTCCLPGSYIFITKQDWRFGLRFYLFYFFWSSVECKDFIYLFSEDSRLKMAISLDTVWFLLNLETDE